jgi:hypothetical protein
MTKSDKLRHVGQFFFLGCELDSSGTLHSMTGSQSVRYVTTGIRGASQVVQYLQPPQRKQTAELTKLIGSEFSE